MAESSKGDACAVVLETWVAWCQRGSRNAVGGGGAASLKAESVSESSASVVPVRELYACTATQDLRSRVPDSPLLNVAFGDAHNGTKSSDSLSSTLSTRLFVFFMMSRPPSSGRLLGRHSPQATWRGSRCRTGVSERSCRTVYSFNRTHVSCGFCNRTRNESLRESDSAAFRIVCVRAARESLLQC